MEYNRLKNMYDEALDEVVAFSDKADYLAEKPKQQFLDYKLKAFKQRIDTEHKREAFVRKSANKFFKISLKEMKRELKENARRRRQELFKLRLLTELRGDNEIAPVENTANCETCEHCYFDETNCSLCCKAYNLVFTSEEMYMQFCKCFCNAYTAYKASEIVSDEPVEQPTTDEVPDNEQANKGTVTPPETTTEQAKTPEAELQEPSCCKECSACAVDENEAYYCAKYAKYLDASDADSVCCCERDGFFGESD